MNAIRLTMIVLFFSGCALLTFRKPAVDDFPIYPVKHAADASMIRRDGIYYLIQKEQSFPDGPYLVDENEHSDYVLYFYNPNELVLCIFGADSMEPSFETTIPMIKKMALSDDINWKGQYRMLEPDKIKMEVCDGYPSRGYYFIQFDAAIAGDKIMLRQHGHQKFRHTMRDFEPGFGRLGVASADTLVFKKF